MRITLLTILTFFTVCIAAPASNHLHKDTVRNAEQHSINVSFYIYDHLTHDRIDSVRVYFLNASDSSIIEKAKIQEETIWNMNNDYVNATKASVDIDRTGKYLFRVESDGYTTVYVPFELKKIYKREKYIGLKPVYLHRVKARNDLDLDEIVVKATKLKFYMDGDTLVYDADAFSMAEGSMLNDLIKKMPGVELEKGGVIKVNGKKVDAMLLNGKDFFDKDRELMLDNMPAYMVKSVNSYERVPEELKNTPKAKTAQKEMVLDVRLKKDYNEGWIMTAEGGGGSTSRCNDDGEFAGKFLGRLFATRYTNLSRFIAYANTNNLNDSSGPDNEGNWGDLHQTQGITTSAEAGLNYYKEFDESQKYQGTLKVAYRDISNGNYQNARRSNVTNESYTRSSYAKQSYDVDFTTEHEYKLDKSDMGEGSPFKYVYLDIRPYFYYLKWNNHSESASAELERDVASNLGKAWLDSIKAPFTGDLLKKYAINRTINNTKANGHWYNSHNRYNFSFYPAHNDNLGFSTNLRHRHTGKVEDTFEHNPVEKPQKGETEFYNRYKPVSTHENEYYVSQDIWVGIGEHFSIEGNLGYRYKRSKDNQPLYMLNALGDDWNDHISTPSLGMLPSVEEWLMTIDKDNSSYKDVTLNIFDPMIFFAYANNNDSTGINHNMWMTFNPRLESEHWYYQQGTVLDTEFKRKVWLFQSNVNYYWSNQKKNRRFSSTLSFNQSAPDMAYNITAPNTTDPLNERHGNTDLKKPYDISLYSSVGWKVKKIMYNAYVNASVRPDAIAMGYTYDKEAGGKRTFLPENVNGNWNADIGGQATIPLDKDDKWRLFESVVYSFNNNVDIVETRSVVKNHVIGNDISLGWNPSKKVEFKLKGSLNIQNSRSERVDFSNIEAYTFNYGASVRLELPWNIQLNSDLTMYSRRGYETSEMNNNELVWNARIAKRICKGKLTLMFDGMDILGNLSNVQYNVNGQGRTETFYNVIPSYGLLRLVYRLNKEPRQK